MNATAEAFGEAVATAWAGELFDCGCAMPVDDTASTMASVVAEATLNVLRDICVSAPLLFLGIFAFVLSDCSSVHLLLQTLTSCLSISALADLVPAALSTDHSFVTAQERAGDGESYSEDALINRLVSEEITLFADAFASIKQTLDHAGEATCEAVVMVDTGVQASTVPDDEPGAGDDAADGASDTDTVYI